MALSEIVDVDFEKRWAVWLERGRVHDRRVKARLRIALPVVALIAVACGYVLIAR
jgi:hypothetical protein